jgi:hypothetical protein
MRKMSQRSTLVTRALKIYLDVMFWLLLIPGCILVVMMPFVVFNAPKIEDADVQIPVRFSIDEEALMGSAPRSDLVVPFRVEGCGGLEVSSASRVVWAGFLLSIILILAVAAFVLHQLRALLRTVSGGDPFHPRNARRIKIVGWVVIAWQLVVPPVQYLVANTFVGQISVRGITLKPPVDFRIEALFLGMAILVLAEIFRQASALKREATELREDQSLTI